MPLGWSFRSSSSAATPIMSHRENTALLSGPYWDLDGKQQRSCAQDILKDLAARGLSILQVPCRYSLSLFLPIAFCQYDSTPLLPREDTQGVLFCNSHICLVT